MPTIHPGVQCSDEADCYAEGSSQAVGLSVDLCAVIVAPEEAQNLEVHITPLTEIATRHLLGGSGKALTDVTVADISRVNRDVVEAFGLGDTHLTMLKSVMAAGVSENY